MAGEQDLTSGLLLDTLSLVRWLAEPRKLTARQNQALSQALDSGELLAISEVTLVEIASTYGRESRKPTISADEIFDVLEADPGLKIVPIDVNVGRETAALGELVQDLRHRVIVATARVHRLRLVTSDQAIIDSNLVSVVE